MLSRSYQLLFASSALLLSSGCAMCCGLYDNDYLATSDLLERTDPSHGRVGSVFSDPNVGQAGHWSDESEMLLGAPESLPGPINDSPTHQPTPAGPTPTAPSVALPGRELIQRPTQTPAKPISVKEDPQSRRSTPSQPAITTAPRKLATAPATPLPNNRRFPRQPIHQVTARQ